MSIKILTVGSLIVEIMRKELDCPMDRPYDFVGPFPSGGSAIFIDAAARLGNACGMVSAVGDDAFGKCCLDRFRRDHVDMDMIRTVANASTGCAFVSYKSDGSRSFIYYIQQTGSGMIDDDLVIPEKLTDVKWLHLSYNTVCSKGGTRRALQKILNQLPSDAKISFDPNIRSALHIEKEDAKLLRQIMERTNVFFPSEGEAAILTGNSDEITACRQLTQGDKIVVYKKGRDGCIVYEQSNQWEIPAYPVVEVDPTGAGDCFAAGFLTALENKMTPKDCGRFANAVGALAVTKKGPMEGAPTYEETMQLIEKGL